MELSGLSTDQAPPIAAPLKFFLTAPLFAILAGVLVLFSEPASLQTRYSMEAIVITHLITIGFFSFVMLGAMTQMLPVLAGAKINKVTSITSLSHILLSVGLLSMSAAMLYTNQVFNFIAMGSLGIGFLLLLGSIVLSLRSVSFFTPTVKAMSVSIFFAFIIVLMGLYLLSSYAREDISEIHHLVANIHSVWAIFGFAGILIIGVAFQVLPMFYVAPHFKEFCTSKVVIILSIGLLLWLVLNIFYPEYAYIGKFWVALFFWAFTTTVWIKFMKRRRPVSDITVWYWKSSSVFFTLGLFLWVFNTYLEDQYIVIVALLVGGGFIFSVMMGMLYKIIPFLVWFHLNAKGYMTIVTMNEMINKRLAIFQFSLFILSLLMFITSYFLPVLLTYAAIVFIASMIVLEYNIIAPVILYRKTLATKPDFDMSMMQEMN